MDSLGDHRLAERVPAMGPACVSGSSGASQDVVGPAFFVPHGGRVSGIIGP